MRLEIPKTIRLTGLIIMAISCSNVKAALSSSAYQSISTDRTICGTTTLLSHTITLAGRDTVLVQSDGRYFPAGVSAGNIRITVDSKTASSDAFIDWRQMRTGSDPQQHS